VISALGRYCRNDLGFLRFPGRQTANFCHMNGRFTLSDRRKIGVRSRRFAGDWRRASTLGQLRWSQFDGGFCQCSPPCSSFRLVWRGAWANPISSSLPLSLGSSAPDAALVLATPSLSSSQLKMFASWVNVGETLIAIDQPKPHAPWARAGSRVDNPTKAGRIARVERSAGLGREKQETPLERTAYRPAGHLVSTASRRRSG
jgi:hypothetical protein